MRIAHDGRVLDIERTDDGLDVVAMWWSGTPPRLRLQLITRPNLRRCLRWLLTGSE